MRSNEMPERLTLVMVDSAPALELATSTHLFALGHALFEPRVANRAFARPPRLRLVSVESLRNSGEAQ